MKSPIHPSGPQPIVQSVAELHRTGRISVAVLHGSLDTYVQCQHPLTNNSRRLLSRPPLQIIKSTTLLHKADGRGTCALFTRFEGNWSQSYSFEFRAQPKTTFVGFNVSASMPREIAFQDAYSHYDDVDEDGLPTYRASKGLATQLRSLTELDACVRDARWFGFNELNLEINRRSLAFFGSTIAQFLGKNGVRSQYKQLLPLVKSYYQLTGIILPLYAYNDAHIAETVQLGGHCVVFAPYTLQELPTDHETLASIFAEDPPLQIVPPDSDHYSEYSELLARVQNALAQLGETCGPIDLPLDSLVVDVDGVPVPQKSWFDHGYKIDRATGDAAILHYVHSLTPESDSAALIAAFYRALLYVHLWVRLQIAYSTLSAALDSLDDQKEPVHRQQIESDLALLAEHTRGETALPPARTLIHQLPPALRTVELCAEAVRAGAPLSTLPSTMAAEDFARIAIERSRSNPKILKTIPVSYATQHPDHYRDILLSSPHVSYESVHQAAPNFAEIIGEMARRNPLYIRQVPQCDVGLETYKSLAVPD